MTAPQILGAAILLVIFGGISAVIAADLGWRLMLGVWAFALTMTVSIVIAVMLMVGWWPA